MQINGQFTRPLVIRVFGQAFGFVLQTVIMALLKPWAVILAIVVLSYFGFSGLVAHLGH